MKIICNSTTQKTTILIFLFWYVFTILEIIEHKKILILLNLS